MTRTHSTRDFKVHADLFHVTKRVFTVFTIDHFISHLTCMPDASGTRIDNPDEQSF
jgi:hypothetical protein